MKNYIVKMQYGDTTLVQLHHLTAYSVNHAIDRIMEPLKNYKFQTVIEGNVYIYRDMENNFIVAVSAAMEEVT